MPSADQPSTRGPEEPSEVDLLLRLARRWRRLGSAQGLPGRTPGAGLTPHQERGLMATARLTHRSWGCSAEQSSPPPGATGQKPSAPGRPAEGDASGCSAEHPMGVRISRLAEHLGIAPRSATEVADALQEAGLVVRAPDPTDRRAVLLTLTPEGRDAVGAAQARRRAAGDQAVAGLSPSDRAQLRRLLLTLLDGTGTPGPSEEARR